MPSPPPSAKPNWFQYHANSLTASWCAMIGVMLTFFGASVLWRDGGRASAWASLGLGLLLLLASALCLQYLLRHQKNVEYFDFQGREIRTMHDENGQLLLYADDLLLILEIEPGSQRRLALVPLQSQEYLRQTKFGQFLTEKGAKELLSRKNSRTSIQLQSYLNQIFR